jgi:hypothetical protein
MSELTWSQADDNLITMFCSVFWYKLCLPEAMNTWLCAYFHCLPSNDNNDDDIYDEVKLPKCCDQKQTFKRTMQS